jgi:hypothetical protein
MSFTDEVIRDEVSDLVPLDVLERELIDGAAEVNSHLAWWLGRVAEFDRREGWGRAGAKSCAHWLGWRCGIDRRTAREHVRVARALEGLALVQSAFASGRLTYSKVRALCRVATAENEAFLLELAYDLSAAQLERSVQAYAIAHGPPLSLEDDEARRRKCGVTSWVDTEGLTHTEIISAPEDSLLMDLAMRYGRDQLYEKNKATVAAAGEESVEDGLRGPAFEPGARRSAENRLDALKWVVRQGLVNAARPDLVDDQRYLIVIHVKEGEAVITDDGRVDLGNGMVVHPRTLQRLGCDALFQTLIEGSDDRPLDLGRGARTVTVKQKRALMSMYSTCAFPGCETDVRFCHFHHVHFWEHDGPSNLDNYRPLCSRHHHICHEGGFRFFVDERGQCFVIPPRGGEPLRASPMLPLDVAPDALVKRNHERGVHPTPAGPEMAGRLGGEAMTAFALDNNVRSIHDATVVDPSLRGNPPSPN